MDLREVFGVAGVPVIVGLVEVVKRLWPEAPAGVWALFALAFGVLLNVVVGQALGVELVVTLVTGVVAGLAASGLYSGGKAVLEAK